MHNIGSCSQTWPTELDAASKSPMITNTPPPMALPSTARSTELLLAIGTGTGERYMSCTISESVARCALHFSAHVSSRSASCRAVPCHPSKAERASPYPLPPTTASDRPDQSHDDPSTMHQGGKHRELRCRRGDRGGE